VANKVISAIRTELIKQADEETKRGASHYFKEGIILYGVKTASVEKIASRYFPEVKPLGKKGVLKLCEELLKSGYMEEAFIACEWSYRFHKEYEAGDFSVFERWVKNYIDNWAKCDTLCNHTIGSIVDKYPQFLENLKQWTKSENRWLRRASSVTLIIPAKEGKFLPDIFEIADNLLTDQDDLVQKGYGWLLKVASSRHQAEVLAYVMKNRNIMPRTALRYAIEKMPADLKRQAMSKG
jgi:3-methyladenine DNA glycosylase AlkD